MKQILLPNKHCLLAIVLIAFVYGCQYEDTEPNILETQKINALNFTARKLKTHQVFEQNKQLAQFINAGFLNDSQKSENVSSSLYNFTIDTTNVQIIYADHFNSYTFIAESDQPAENVLENYVLTVFNNGSYAQMLVHYPFTYVNNEIVYDYTNAYAEYIIDDSLLLAESTSPCPSESQEILEWEDNGCVAIYCNEGGNHPPGEVCNDGVQRSYWDCGGAWVIVGCVQTSSGSGTGAFGSPTGGGTTTTDEPAPDEEIPVIPLNQTPLEEIIECINGIDTFNQQPRLTNIMITWLENNRINTIAINDFLKENNCSNEAIDIALYGIEKIMNLGEANFQDLVFKEESFKDSNLDCIHKELMQTDNFYSEMISKFYDNNGTVITYEIGSVAAGEWGNTKGSFDNFGEMSVTFSQEVDNFSNLSKKVTLCHEMIHVYMFNSLEEWQFINFDINGKPYFTFLCPQGINYNNINLNTLSIKSRFVAIICAFRQNQNLTSNWTHELFGLWNFDTNTYVNKVKTFLLQNHDWDNENTDFKNEAIAIFGQLNWKEEVAEAAAWIGLEQTSEFAEYKSNYQGVNNFNKLQYILDIKIKLQSAKNDCL